MFNTTVSVSVVDASVGQSIEEQVADNPETKVTNMSVHADTHRLIAQLGDLTKCMDAFGVDDVVMSRVPMVERDLKEIWNMVTKFRSQVRWFQEKHKDSLSSTHNLNLENQVKQIITTAKQHAIRIREKAQKLVPPQVTAEFERLSLQQQKRVLEVEELSLKDKKTDEYDIVYEVPKIDVVMVPTPPLHFGNVRRGRLDEMEKTIPFSLTANIQRNGLVLAEWVKARQVDEASKGQKKKEVALTLIPKLISSTGKTGQTVVEPSQMSLKPAKPSDATAAGTEVKANDATQDRNIKSVERGKLKRFFNSAKKQGLEVVQAEAKSHPILLFLVLVNIFFDKGSFDVVQREGIAGVEWGRIVTKQGPFGIGGVGELSSRTKDEWMVLVPDDDRKMILKASKKLFDKRYMVLLNAGENMQFNPKSKSTPTRPVMDASSRTPTRSDGSGGRCLNDLVCHGKVETLNLLRMVLRVIMDLFGLARDLSQFCNCFRLLEDFRHLQQFLHRENLEMNEEVLEGVIVTAQSETAIFGIATEVRERMPALAEVRSNFDYSGDSKATKEEIVQIAKDGDQEIGQEASPDIRSAVYSCVASMGQEDNYNAVQRLYEEKEHLARSGLAAFSSKLLPVMTREFSSSSSAKSQDSVLMIGIVARNKRYTERTVRRLIKIFSLEETSLAEDLAELGSRELLHKKKQASDVDLVVDAIGDTIGDTIGETNGETNGDVDDLTNECDLQVSSDDDGQGVQQPGGDAKDQLTGQAANTRPKQSCNVCCCDVHRGYTIHTKAKAVFKEVPIAMLTEDMNLDVLYNLEETQPVTQVGSMAGLLCSVDLSALFEQETVVSEVLGAAVLGLYKTSEDCLLLRGSVLTSLGLEDYSTGNCCGNSLGLCSDCKLARQASVIARVLGLVCGNWTDFRVEMTFSDFRDKVQSEEAWS